MSAGIAATSPAFVTTVARTDPVSRSSTFQVISGPNSGPCPTGGLPPFKPGLIAGTINNRAGSFSPFYLRLFRSDSEQEITHFSIKLPPGITGMIEASATRRPSIPRTRS